MKRNILSEIKSQYEFLTRVEKNIADLILSDRAAFIKYSMAEVSFLAGVSQGSINNFAKKFCPEGFSAFKLSLAASADSEAPLEVINPASSIKAAMEIKITENARACRATLEANGEEALCAAADKFLSARRVDIYGIYHSGIVAKDLSFQLMRLGIAANFVEDTLMCSVSASMLTKDDLVIAVTSSGRTKEIIDAAKIAKENGAAVLSVTGNKFSPMAQLSDIALYSLSSGMSVSDRADEIRNAQLLVVDTLCSYLRAKIADGKRNNYYRLVDILNSHSIED